MNKVAEYWKRMTPDNPTTYNEHLLRTEFWAEYKNPPQEIIALAERALAAHSSHADAEAMHSPSEDPLCQAWHDAHDALINICCQVEDEYWKEVHAEMVAEENQQCWDEPNEI